MDSGLSVVEEIGRLEPSCWGFHGWGGWMSESLAMQPSFNDGKPDQTTARFDFAADLKFWRSLIFAKSPLLSPLPYAHVTVPFRPCGMPAMASSES